MKKRSLHGISPIPDCLVSGTTICRSDKVPALFVPAAGKRRSGGDIHSSVRDGVTGTPMK